MAEELVQTDSAAQPGLLGRAIRASLGLAALSFLFLLLTVWRRELWAAEVPLLDARFWVLIGFAFWGTMPASYAPRLERVGQASNKVYAMDGARYVDLGAVTFSQWTNADVANNFMVDGPWNGTRSGEPYEAKITSEAQSTSETSRAPSLLASA